MMGVAPPRRRACGVLLTLWVATACWDSSPEPELFGTQPRPARARLVDTLVRTFEFDVQPGPRDAGALGSVFTFVSADGETRCEAGFLHAVGTRLYANNNDLEFWCRPKRERLTLEWRPIGPPREGAVLAQVGNVGGFLFDYRSNRFFEPRAGAWRALTADDSIHIRGSRIYSIRGDPAERFAITLGLPNCTGLSVFSRGGYHGTLPAGEDFGAVAVVDGVLYANVEGELVRAPLHDARTDDDECVALLGTSVGDLRLWSYGFFPLGGALLVGGGGKHHLSASKVPLCPAVVAFEGDFERRVPLAGCTGDDVTEIYSFVQYGGGAVFGTYPDGRLYSLLPDSVAAIRLPTPGTVMVPSDGERYFESQSLAVTSGELLIGLYPWGEIVQVDDSSREILHRLFQYPQRMPHRMPFLEAALQAYCPGAEPECIVAAEAKEYWGQRITSIAVLNGEVCAGSGNNRATPFSDSAHAFVGRRFARQYGVVWCARLRNQVLAPPPSIQGGRVRFEVRMEHMQVLLDGRPIARSRHSLTAAALSSLSSAGGELRIGAGTYGPSHASLQKAYSRQ